MPAKPTKIRTILKLLRRPSGATIAQLQKATDWQPHSVRAVLTGLRKKGHDVQRDKDAKVVRSWLGRIGVKTLFIETGSPWENGYNESFNGKLRNELLNGEIFYTLKEAQVLIERWRHHYNTVRPHSTLGYRSIIIAFATSH